MSALGCIFLVTISSFVTVNGFTFQSPIMSTTRVNTNTNTLTKSFTSSSSALNVKFRLDNDDDHDEYDTTQMQSEPKFSPKPKSKKTLFYNDNNNNNDETTSSPPSSPSNELNNNKYETKAPQTTFGAEAVPESQRPANEYMELLTSPLFDWANRENGDIGLSLRLSALYIVLFAFICWPISGASFTMEGYEMHKFFSSNVGAFGFELVLVLRLYTGWGYVGDRLQSKEIEYEETGW